MTRALTMLNESGDNTIAWTEDRDDEMEEIIARKMAQGVTFFIIEPRFFGFFPPKKTKLESAGDARRHRILSIPDEDFARFVESGAGELVPTPDAPVKTLRKAKTAAEAARAETVGVKPMKGG
jgi:hypothetical protein